MIPVSSPERDAVMTRDVVSVIRDRDFVQIGSIVRMKIKSSVAGGMHLPVPGPKLRQVGVEIRLERPSRPVDDASEAIAEFGGGYARGGRAVTARSLRAATVREHERISGSAA
mgnify:CR=1 FL=1